MSWHELQVVYERLSRGNLYPDSVDNRRASTYYNLTTADSTEFLIHIRQFTGLASDGLPPEKNNFCRFSMLSSRQTIDIELGLDGHRVENIRWLKRIDMSERATAYEPQMVYDAASETGNRETAIKLATAALKEIAKHESRGDLSQQWGTKKICNRAYFYDLKVDGNARSRHSERRLRRIQTQPGL